jgi:hypothetical protein
LGQVGFDQDNFGGFFVGHLLASALGELLDRFLALLDQRSENRLGFFLIERRHFFDLAILERGFHHAQGRKALLLARLHGGGDILLDLFDEAHEKIIIAGALATVSRLWQEPPHGKRASSKLIDYFTGKDCP